MQIVLVERKIIFVVSLLNCYVNEKGDGEHNANMDFSLYFLQQRRAFAELW